MVALLEQRRYDVFHAVDAEQANEALQVQHFGLVVCDPSIPLKQLRQPEKKEAGWLVELHDSDTEPSLERRSNGASTEAVIEGLGNLERVTELLDRLLDQSGEFAASPVLAGALALNLPVLDREMFRRQMHNDPALMGEIIRLYLKETKHQLDEIDVLVRRRNGGPASRIAHTLKGSFSAVFASRAVAVARELEMALVASDFGLALALLDPLAESAAAAEIALREFL
jgi:HPt (histidine-containing phosphotransfer) domain-containing protein